MSAGLIVKVRRGLTFKAWIAACAAMTAMDEQNP
jgi:hypothetical protein